VVFHDEVEDFLRHVFSSGRDNVTPPVQWSQAPQTLPQARSEARPVRINCRRTTQAQYSGGRATTTDRSCNERNSGNIRSGVFWSALNCMKDLEGTSIPIAEVRTPRRHPVPSPQQLWRKCASCRIPTRLMVPWTLRCGIDRRPYPVLIHDREQVVEQGDRRVAEELSLVRRRNRDPISTCDRRPGECTRDRRLVPSTPPIE